MKSIIKSFSLMLMIIIGCSSNPTNDYNLLNEDRIHRVSNKDDRVLLYEYSDDYIIWGDDTLSGVTTKVDSLNVSYPFSPQTVFYVRVLEDSILISHELVNTENTSQIVFIDTVRKGNYGFVLNSNYFDSGLYWLKSIYGHNKPVVKKFVLLK